MFENKYNIQWKENGVVLSFFGIVHIDDIYQTNSKLPAFNNFDRAVFQLWNFSHCEQILVSNKDAAILASLDRAMMIWNRTMKVAIVTTHSNLMLMTKLYIELIKGTGWNCRLFRSVLEAEEWVEKSNLLKLKRRVKISNKYLHLLWTEIF